MTQAPEKPIYRVLSAMLCEGYRQHPDGYLDLIRVGFNQLVPSEFPAAGRLGVAVTIARADERRFTPGEAATINVELVDPGGDAAPVGSNSFIQEAELGGARSPVAQTLMMILEPVLRRPGLHHVVVSITNGEDPVSLPLFVVHA